ncbi:DNA repair protein Rad18 [Eremomyces bilateralis CBS 781.70]|uniref:DNA repair protein Rad18 n=1 Tax=Eremomyces bilateralis CBS 781.70 TaxID=1392243 RepID=A0A6G1FZW4_9PEZI|nr:DNA repair protein Rad18 [Eremomyces bilateralis CBS 781.70]KAF1811318.1 DNA repair protein Rad18 [Eremomyces bilateralis CBS 781.70]
MPYIASSKRSRTDGDENEDILSESAAPSFRQEPRKRVRLSQQPEDDDESSDGSALVVDLSTDGEEDSVLGDQESNQASHDPVGDHLVNTPAECGIIEEVSCTNFMCHSRLEVKLGPLINFIIGHNGSGKSAVLTALTLCLGGKAASTNRGQSLKAFIKEGQENATLAVKLKNQGPGAYKHDVYGKSIIVERQFSKSGSSGFRIKSAQGKIISTKKKDLEDITDAFCLQLDNPMMVLTQDMARQFLSSSTPSDKYKFFYKGTQLETLDHDYKLIAEKIDLIEHQMELKEQDLGVLKRRYQDAKKQSERAEAMRSIGDKIRENSRKLAWCQVVEQENLLAEHERKLETNMEKIESLRESQEAMSVVYEQEDEKATDCHNTIVSLRDSKQPHEDERKKWKEASDENSSDLTDALGQERDVHGERESARKGVAKCRQDIEAEKRRIEMVDGGEHARKQEELVEVKAKLQRAIQELDQNKKDLADLRENDKSAVNDVRAAEDRLREKEGEIKMKERQINDLGNQERQWMDAYPRGLQQLLRLIQNDRRFRERPVGPIGSHVRLKDPKWSSVLERFFGGVLNNFVVTSPADRRVLAELMTKAGYNFPIIIGNGDPSIMEKVSRNEPAPHILTIMRVLEIDNDLVRNQLIINQSIEHTALAENIPAGTKLMTSDKPAKVKRCLSLNEHRRGFGQMLSLTQAGGHTSGPVNVWRDAPRMLGEVDAQLDIEREALQALKSEFSDLQNDKRSETRKLEECRKDIRNLTHRGRGLLVAQQRAEGDVESLENQITDSTPEQGKINSLEDFLASKEKELDVLERTFAQFAETIKGLKAKQADIDQHSKEAQKEIATIDSNISRLEVKEDKLKHKRQQALFQKNEAIAKVADANVESELIKENIEKQRGTVEEFIEGASNISARVAIEPNETHRFLESKHERLLKEQADSTRELGGTVEELEQKAFDAKMLLVMARNQQANLEHAAQMLKNALVNRRLRWQQFRKIITVRARGDFRMKLAERKFRGDMIISHTKHELDIRVEPDMTRGQSHGRQTKTLSGGEKSFSTICLLLALWDAMGSKIRCLDEFDVFMDSVNRSASVSMMISAARDSVSRQFILITPQAMGNVELKSDVKVIKMSDPERGQTTLNFGRQN